MAPITFDTHPDQYRHWRLLVEDDIATLVLDVDEEGGLASGYTLKLNSYDLGVDIELHDALQRIRFEHPRVRAVIITSGKERMFCSGANIYMLGQSSHDWKVNFCKFTNETRNAIEDASAASGIKFIAAVNGACAGGGYELALACDEIFLVDDRSSTVSLPEVPLLGVLPGTGGLTRVIDKRKVRRDLADVFATTAEGVKGARAKEWKLVDEIAPPNAFMDRVRARAKELAATSPRPQDAEGIVLPPLERSLDETGYHYRYVDVVFDRPARAATVTITAPETAPADLAGIRAAGAQWWPLVMVRELDDALCLLRTNEAELGCLLLKTRGSPDAVLACDQALGDHADDWFVREVTGLLRRTFSRLDLTARALLALIDEGSCFVGTLFELALAADRSYMLDLAETDGATPPQIALSSMNFGPYAMANGLTRLATRFADDRASVEALERRNKALLDAREALDLGLITFAPDELDWEDEVRLAVEERASLSPDALTGLEGNLRFGARETTWTRIFGRLSAWQNWVFSRPNAVGEQGALKTYGTGSKPVFDWKRV